MRSMKMHLHTLIGPVAVGFAIAGRSWPDILRASSHVSNPASRLEVGRELQGTIFGGFRSELPSKQGLGKVMAVLHGRLLWVWGS